MICYEAGLMDDWMEGMGNFIESTIPRVKKESYTPITVHDLGGVGLIYLTCIIGTLISLAIENYYYGTSISEIQHEDSQNPMITVTSDPFMRSQVIKTYNPIICVSVS